MSDEIPPSAIDEQFAKLLVKLNGNAEADLERVARTVSAWRGAGHICVPLSALGSRALAKKLQATRLVGGPGEFKPLILDEAGRLYLQRYWTYEHELVQAIAARLCDADHDSTLLADGLQRLFPEEANAGQRLAAETAVRKKFCVITGGPGTGKTYTMARVLALLADQCAAKDQVPHIALAAPTGKAAARMQETLARSLAQMPDHEKLLPVLANEASTLHRLLGAVPGSPYFRHHRGHPLAVDAVIVDEASMVDLALMAKLFDALPETARVILIGDRDQLASVEAGNVLGDICRPPGDELAPIAAHIVELRGAHRFQTDSGIQRLSAQVNAGDSEGALALLREAPADLRCQPTPPAPRLEAALRSRVIEGFGAMLSSSDPTAVLDRLGDFRILCALRRGPFGVENLNVLAERVLATEGVIAPEGTQYHGRPILVRTNDYQLKLFNGDVGLILRDEAADGDLRAFFLDTTGALRRILPARLPAHETSFAMTVHKSQGSEFARVLLVLPDKDSPVITRELLYTGLTRARHSVELWAHGSLLQAAITRRTVRSSGLSDALWRL